MVWLSPRSFRVLDEAARPQAGGGDHVGLVLREARLAAGYEIGQIATSLRIRHGYLAAIEDGRFDVLPGPTYVVGFVRSYAEYLGLRPDVLVDRFKAEAGGVGRRQALDFPTPMPEGRFPGGAMLAVGAVLAAAVCGGWYYLDQHGRLTYPRVPALPSLAASPPARPAAAAPFVASVPPAAERRAVPAAIQPAAAGATPVETARVVTEAPPARDPAAPLAVPPPHPEISVAGEEEAPAIATTGPAETIPPEAGETEADDAVASAAGGPAPSADPAAAATPSSPAAPVPPAALPTVPVPPQAPATVAETGRTLGRVNHDSRIILNATADSWVQVRDGAQNVVFTQMLRAGDSYRVPNRDGLVLLTGNAGGLVIAVDGNPVPMLGPEGTVLRNVRLEAEALRTGTATRN